MKVSARVSREVCPPRRTGPVPSPLGLAYAYRRSLGGDGSHLGAARKPRPALSLEQISQAPMQLTAHSLRSSSPHPLTTTRERLRQCHERLFYCGGESQLLIYGFGFPSLAAVRFCPGAVFNPARSRHSLSSSIPYGGSVTMRARKRAG